MKIPLFFRRVVGHSMEPSLHENQLVFATGLIKARTGDVVIAEVNGREVIKRVAKIEKDTFKLTSDAPGHARYANVVKSEIRGKLLLPKLLV